MTETERRLLLSERYEPIDDDCNGYYKNKNEIVFFDINVYLKNRDLYHNHYNKIRIHHQTLDDIETLKKNGINVSKTKLLHPIALIDSNYLKLYGSKYQTERNYRNKYSKMNFEVTNKIKDMNEIMLLLDEWNTNKKILGTKMTFTGHDRSFFKRYLTDLKKKYDIHEYYFYKDSILMGYIITENIDGKNMLAHSRKSKRFGHNGFDYYIDYYAYNDMFNKYGEYTIDLGYEVGKLTTYKSEHFNIIKIIDKYNLTII